MSCFFLNPSLEKVLEEKIAHEKFLRYGYRTISLLGKWLSHKYLDKRPC